MSAQNTFAHRFTAATGRVMCSILLCTLFSQSTNATPSTATFQPMSPHLERLPAKPLSPSSHDQPIQSFELAIKPQLSHHGIEENWFYGLVEAYADWQDHDGQLLDETRKLAIANTLLHRLRLTLSAESLQCLGCQDEMLPSEAQVQLAQSPNPTKHYAAADDRFQAAWPELSMDNTLGTHWDDVRLALLADALLGRESAMAPTDATDY